MRTLITIRKRGAGYIMDISGPQGSLRQGAQCGITPYEAATTAAREMALHASPQANPDGGDLMAPPEVMELVPETWRNVAPRS